MLILYFILGIIIIGVAYSYYQTEKEINGFLMFSFGYALYYVLIPFLLEADSLFSLNLLNERFKNEFASNGDIKLITFLVVLSFYVIYICFYFLLKKVKFKKKRYKILVNEEKLIKAIANILTFFGVASLILIIMNLGGVMSSLKMSEILRAYGTDMSKYMPQIALYAYVLSPSIIASLFLNYYTVKRYSSSKLFLYVSILFSIYYLLFFAGRLPILMVIICFSLHYILRKFKHPVIVILLLGIASLFLLGKLDDLFFYISYGYVKTNNLSFLESTVKEFSFPYRNLCNVSEMNNMYGLRYGVDYLSPIINIIPTSVLNIFNLGKVSSSYTFISSFYDQSGTAMGGTPTDLLTFSLRQLGVMWIPFQALISAAFCSFLDKVIKSIDTRFSYISIRLATIMFVLVAYHDLDSFIRNRFDMLLLLIIFAVLNRYNRNETSRKSSDVRDIRSKERT